MNGVLKKGIREKSGGHLKTWHETKHKKTELFLLEQQIIEQEMLGVHSNAEQCLSYAHASGYARSWVLNFDDSMKEKEPQNYRSMKKTF